VREKGGPERFPFKSTITWGNYGKASEKCQGLLKKTKTVPPKILRKRRKTFAPKKENIERKRVIKNGGLGTDDQAETAGVQGKRGLRVNKKGSLGQEKTAGKKRARSRFTIEVRGRRGGRSPPRLREERIVLANFHSSRSFL